MSERYLNQDTFQLLFAYCDYNDLLNLAHTCRELRRMVIRYGNLYQSAIIPNYAMAARILRNIKPEHKISICRSCGYPYTPWVRLVNHVKNQYMGRNTLNNDDLDQFVWTECLRCCKKIRIWCNRICRFCNSYDKPCGCIDHDRYYYNCRCQYATCTDCIAHTSKKVCVLCNLAHQVD